MASESSPGSEDASFPDFIAEVGRSGVLTADQFEDLLSRVRGGAYPRDPAALAEHLVRDGTLTGFQARRLQSGKRNGLVMGRYAVLDRIDAGGMGIIFKARHQLMDRVVALKIISREHATRPGSVARFLREMRLVALLDHPNVIRAFDADLFHEIPYIVMEYVPGENLLQILKRRGPLPPAEVVDYMAQAARGLAHAHERGVIHRDVKPSNMLVDSEHVVKVLDLGLGAFADDPPEEERGRVGDIGMTAGTMKYISPEQLAGRPVDGRADLFSLGCSMYCLLTGALPFPGASRTEQLASRGRKRHVPIRDVRPDLPSDLVAVVDRLLANQPEERFPSAADAAESLAVLVRREERSPSGRRAGLRVKPATPATDLTKEPGPPPLDWSLIEKALAPNGRRSQEASPSERARKVASPDLALERLKYHRKSVEGAGAGSGQDVESRYYAELVRAHRAVIGKPDRAQVLESGLLGDRCLDYAGELLDRFLSLSSPTLILIAILAIILALWIALGAVLV